MKDYSLEALLSFCYILRKIRSEDKRVMWNRRSACRGVISLLPEDIQKDVRKVDPDEAIKAYMLAKPGASEYTIREYKRRLKQTLRAFISSETTEGDEYYSADETEQTRKNSSSRQSATVPNFLRVVLRSDFVAELCLPYDISADEATFLSKHLTLAAEGTSILQR